MTELEMAVQELRDVLDKTFAPDTAVAGTTSAVPSAGHCAVAAIVAQRRQPVMWRCRPARVQPRIGHQ